MKEYEHVKTMTLEEYEELPEDVRVELIEGEVFEMTSPAQTHQIKVGIYEDLYIDFEEISTLL